MKTIDKILFSSADVPIINLKDIFFRDGKIYESNIIVGGKELDMVIEKLKPIKETIDTFDDLRLFFTETLKGVKKTSNLSGYCSEEREIQTVSKILYLGDSVRDYIPKENKNMGELFIDLINYKGRVEIKVM